MLYKVMVMLHVLGASVWVGGHAVLMTMVLPKAVRNGDAKQVLEFERANGCLGLGTLIIQLVTGLWLVNRWVGD